MACAVLTDGELEELFFDELEANVGKIFAGKVEKIVPGLGAAFVKIGKGKGSFLKLNELCSTYKHLVLEGQELKEGMKLLVQMKKEPTESKGAQVTTCIGIAERFVVIFPFKKVTGVSKKIKSAEERKRLKEIALKLRKKHDMGVVIRTAAEGVDEQEIEKNFLEARRRWEQILEDFRKARTPKVLYEENPLERVVKEKLNSKIDRVVYNQREILKILEKYLRHLPKKPTLEFVEGDPFEKFQIYDKIKKLSARVVPLRSGGNIVIDRLEALTVIDVNSESDTTGEDQEELALKTNLEAAEEIVRQVKLRNIGGMILVDFMKLKESENREKLLKFMKQLVKKDSSQMEVLGFTNLGLLEIVRRRTSKSLESIFFTKCPVCSGTGKVIAQKLLLKKIVSDIKKITDHSEIVLKVHPNMSGYKDELERVGKNSGKKIKVEFNWPDPNSYDITAKKGGA